MERIPTVAIVGGGFSGMLTAALLFRKSDTPLKVVIVNEGRAFGRGIAFDPYSDTHLLNVMAGKMSAFVSDPDHFINWIIDHHVYPGLDKELIAKTYLPRSLYGNYLDQVWKEALRDKSVDIELEIVEERVVDIQPGKKFNLTLASGKNLAADQVVLATGNSLPGHPDIRHNDFYASKNYYADPWSPATVKNLKSRHDILIIGNGLTMVDTVLGLREAGFNKTIYSISPDGFSILQHRHNGMAYPSMIGELREPYHLVDLVNLFNKHRKAIRTLGLSAEPVIDSLRPFTQKIWLGLSDTEKEEFMRRLRHLWGVARHRLPIHIHDLIVRLKLDGKLLVRAGKIQDIVETSDGIRISFYNKKTKKEEIITVERVINCTGPEPDISKSENMLLRNLCKTGVLVPDSLKQGAMADPDTFMAINSLQKKVDSLYLIGNILKGLLWESTAVPELRVQADRIAEQILMKVSVPAR